MKKIKYLILLVIAIFGFSGCAFVGEMVQNEIEKEQGQNSFWPTVPAKPDISEKNGAVLHDSDGDGFTAINIFIDRKNPYCRVSLYRAKRTGNEEIRDEDYECIVCEANVMRKEYTEKNSSNKKIGYFIADPSAKVGTTYSYKATCVILGNSGDKPTREGPRSEPIEITVQ